MTDSESEEFTVWDSRVVNHSFGVWNYVTVCFQGNKVKSHFSRFSKRFQVNCVRRMYSCGAGSHRSVNTWYKMAWQGATALLEAWQLTSDPCFCGPHSALPAHTVILQTGLRSRTAKPLEYISAHRLPEAGWVSSPLDQAP